LLGREFISTTIDELRADICAVVYTVGFRGKISAFGGRLEEGAPREVARTNRPPPPLGDWKKRLALPACC
jgi:hypothetical protein